MAKDNNSTQTNTIIGPNTTVQGDLEVNGSILVYGSIVGDLRINGSIRTAKDSYIKGTVVAEEAVIDGVLEGSLSTKGRSTLGSTATLLGEVQVELLVIEEGAKFSGNCMMTGVTPDGSSRAAVGASAKQKDEAPVKNDEEASSEPVL